MAAPKGNQFHKGMSDGRPRKYNDPEDMLKKAEEYFNNEPTPHTMEGCALYLGLVRRTLIEYGKLDDFSHVVEWIRAKSFQNLSVNALEGKYNANFAKFLLINNSDYRDHVDSNVSLSANVVKFKFNDEE